MLRYYGNRDHINTLNRHISVGFEEGDVGALSLHIVASNRLGRRACFLRADSRGCEVCGVEKWSGISRPSFKLSVCHWPAR